MKNNASPHKLFKFSHDVMFNLIMQDEKICKGVLEKLLGEKISEIDSIISQKSQQFITAGKSVRFDICVKTMDGTTYDVEMQRAKKKDFEKRLRFYQIMLDLGTLKPGDSYGDLKNTTVVFICNFDYYNEGEPLYIFPRICENKPRLRMQDGSKFVIVNATAYKKAKDKGLRALLKYIYLGKAEDDMTEMIDRKVRMQELQGAVMEYLSLMSPHEMDIREDAMEKGLKEGREEGAYQTKCETAKNLLEMGLSIEQVAQGTGLSVEEIARLR